MAELSTCPGCGRHCNINNLHCGRGKQIVANLKAKDDSSSSEAKEPLHSKPVPQKPSVEVPEIDQKLVQKLGKLGRCLSYLDENHKNEEIISIFKALSQLEKESLLSQLDKLNISSIEIPKHQSHHKKHGGHHHYHHKHGKHLH